MIKINIKKKKINTINSNLLPIYIYIPDKIKFKKKKKIIIVIEKIFRTNKNIKNICKNISKHQYISVLPKLLYKIKKINFKKNIDKLGEKINFLSDKEIILNIIYLIKWLKKKYKNNKIGIIGFNWGGRITWLLSYFQEKYIKTSVIWNGKISNIKNYKHPIQPIEIIDKIKIPILGLYSEKNNNLILKKIKKIKKKINNKSKIIIYQNKQNNTLSNKLLYNKKITKKTWKKMINWFNINL